MAIEFPSNPVDGQIVTYGALRYRYFASKNYWKSSEIPPVSPIVSFSTTTGILSYNQSANLSITAYQGYVLSSITVDNESWVTVYTGSTKRTEDQYRTIREDPLSTSGVVAELIANTTGTYLVVPGVYSINSDTPITNEIYLKVTNLKTSSTSTTVTLNLIQTGV